MNGIKDYKKGGRKIAIKFENFRSSLSNRFYIKPGMTNEIQTGSEVLVNVSNAYISQ